MLDNALVHCDSALFSTRKKNELDIKFNMYYIEYYKSVISEKGFKSSWENHQRRSIQNLCNTIINFYYLSVLCDACKSIIDLIDSNNYFNEYCGFYYVSRYIFLPCLDYFIKRICKYPLYHAHLHCVRSACTLLMNIPRDSVSEVFFNEQLLKTILRARHYAALSLPTQRPKLFESLYHVKVCAQSSILFRRPLTSVFENPSRRKPFN